MPLTNENLKEIKTAVNRGFGFKLPDPLGTEEQKLFLYKKFKIPVIRGFKIKLTDPNGNKPGEIVVYKEYLVTPVQIKKTGPGSYISVYRRSPTEPRLSTRTLLPGNKLSPSKNGINKLLLRVNGTSPSSRTSNKKSASSGKLSRTAIH
jgi:hypothetical protein